MMLASFQTWVSIAMSVLAGSLGLTAYAFTTFQGKDDAQRDATRIEERLDRIETKLDRMIERGR